MECCCDRNGEWRMDRGASRQSVRRYEKVRGVGPAAGFEEEAAPDFRLRFLLGLRVFNDDALVAIIKIKLSRLMSNVIEETP